MTASEFVENLFDLFETYDSIGAEVYTESDPNDVTRVKISLTELSTSQSAMTLEVEWVNAHTSVKTEIGPVAWLEATASALVTTNPNA